MASENYNGRIQSVRRIYDSFRNFVGNNKVYPCGDILCVSLRNNDSYNLFLHADGVSTFIQLYNKWKSGDSVPVGTDTIGSEQIIDGSILMEDLNKEVKDKMAKTYVEGEELLIMDYDIAQEG